MSSLIDKSGVIHEKGWDGQYRPKQGLFSPQKDTTFWGNPNVERDLFGNAKVERNWLGQPVTSNRGATLYQRSGGSSRRSSSGDEALGGLAALVVILAVIITFAAFFVLVVPLFIALWRGLSSGPGRRDWGLFSLSALILTGLGYLSWLSFDIISGSHLYASWQLLLPVLTVLAWLSLGGLALIKGWLRPIWRSTQHVTMAYGYGVREMWGKVWGWM